MFVSLVGILLVSFFPVSLFKKSRLINSSIVLVCVCSVIVQIIHICSDVTSLNWVLSPSWPHHSLCCHEMCSMLILDIFCPICSQSLPEAALSFNRERYSETAVGTLVYFAKPKSDLKLRASWESNFSFQSGASKYLMSWLFESCSAKKRSRFPLFGWWFYETL